MTDRISTGMMYGQSLSSMLLRQKQLNTLQEQLATGQKLVTAKDDPVAAGTAVGLDRTLAELERFGKNANTVGNRLGLQENVLAQAGDAMARINELAVRANSGALSQEDRRATAQEIRSLRDSLLDLANSTDGSGRYLFGGNADDSPPFATLGGAVVYSGDQTQRRVDVAPELAIADTLPGSEIFLRVRTGDGRVDVTADTANTGTGRVNRYSLVGPEAWDGETYRLEFGAGGSYTVRDAGGLVITTGTHAAGDSIVARGLVLQIEGEPADGDAFNMGAATTRDIFATIDRLADALESSSVTPAQSVQLQNLLGSSMRDIATAQSHLIDARASGGAQLSALENATGLRDAHEVTLKGTLSALRDLDYAEAISRFTLEKTVLDAAQLAFTQAQRLSLFNLIR